MRNLLVVSMVVSSLVLAQTSFAGTTANSEVCALLKKEKESAAYLIDADGRLSAGPINFGRYAYSYEERDVFLVPTGYRVVISPKRIKVVGYSDGGTFYLHETKSVCPNAKTYELSIAVRENKTPDTDWLPYKYDTDNFDFPELEDPRESLFNKTHLKIRFSDRVVGEIYDANSQVK